jgi:hypothetical protein
MVLTSSASSQSAWPMHKTSSWNAGGHICFWDAKAHDLLPRSINPHFHHLSSRGDGFKGLL